MAYCRLRFGALLGWGGAALLTCILFGCTGSISSRSEIVLGAVASLTGPAGEQGESWLRGAQLAVEEAQARGIAVRLVVEDDQTQAAAGVAAFQKLVNVDRVQGIIGGTWDFLAASVFPLAARSRIPFVSPTSPQEMYGAEIQGNPWVFSTALSLNTVRAVALQFCKSRNVRSVGLLYPNVPFGSEQARLLREGLVGAGVAVSFDVEFSVGSAYLDEIRIAAQRAAKARPDLVFAVLDVAGVDMYLTELQRAGATVPLLTTQHLENAFLLAKDKDRYANAYGVYPRLLSTDFSGRYERRFNERPRFGAASGYDAALFLIEGIRQQVSFDSPTAVLRIDGVTGVIQLPAIDHAIVPVLGEVMSTESGIFTAAR